MHQGNHLYRELIETITADQIRHFRSRGGSVSAALYSAGVRLPEHTNQLVIDLERLSTERGIDVFSGTIQVRGLEASEIIIDEVTTGIYDPVADIAAAQQQMLLNTRRAGRSFYMSPEIIRAIEQQQLTNDSRVTSALDVRAEIEGRGE